MKTEKTKKSPAQRGSGISILGVGVLGILRSLGILGKKQKTENTPALRDSKVSKLGMGLIGPMRPMGLMGPIGQKPKMKTTLAQPDSGNSNLKNCPYRPCRPYRPLVFKTTPAQRDSIMSNLGFREHGHTEGVKHTKKAILTKNVKNIMGCFMNRLSDEPMSKMQNAFPQQYSRMSNLKIETENSFPQRHSKMSNERLSGLLCRPHRQKGIFTMQIKNIAGCFGRLSGLLCWPHGGRLSGLLCWPHGGRLSGLLCWPHGRKTETAPAQRDSGNSKLAIRPLCPYCPLCPSVFKTTPAQRDSGIYKLAGQAVEYLIFKAILLLLFSAMNKRWRKNGATDIINRISREYV